MDANSDPVVIVGGGLAGFAAASTLRAASVPVRVLEQRAHFGGRAASGPEGRFPGPLAIGADDRRWHALVAASGVDPASVPLRLMQATAGGAPQPIDASTWQGRLRLPGIRGIDGLRTHRLRRLLRRFGGILAPDSPDDGVRLDDRCVRDFVRLYFGPTALDAWAEPWLRESLGDPNDASRLGFMRDCARDQAREAPQLRVRSMLDALATSDDLPGCTVRSVEPKGGAALVRFDDAGGAEQELEAAGVILATPARCVPALAGNWLTAAERSFYGTATHVDTIALRFALERSAFPQPTRVRVPGTLGSPFAVLQQSPRTTGIEGLVDPDWAQRWAMWDPGRIEVAATGALEAILPAARGRVEGVEVTRVEAAFPRFPVGHFRALAQLGRVECDRLAAGRPLLTAGDWQVGPGVEAACASGVRAAERWLAGIRPAS